MSAVTLVRVPKPPVTEEPGWVIISCGGKYDYVTPDGRWRVESGGYCGGRWKVIDTTVDCDSQPYIVVVNLAAAKAVIAALSGGDI